MQFCNQNIKILQMIMINFKEHLLLINLQTLNLKSFQVSENFLCKGVQKNICSLICYILITVNSIKHIPNNWCSIWISIDNYGKIFFAEYNSKFKILTDKFSNFKCQYFLFFCQIHKTIMYITTHYIKNISEQTSPPGITGHVQLPT